MPLDEEVTQFIRHPYASVYDTRIFPLTGNLRPGLVIQAATAEAATRLFKEIYAALPASPRRARADDEYLRLLLR